MASPADFSRNVRRLSERIRPAVGRIVRQGALAIDQAVVLATPVDTGRARSGWVVSLDAPADSPDKPYAPGDKGSTGAQNAAAALAQGQAVISRYQSGRNSSVHISNNVEYIGELNNGTSAQAPAEFVEKAVQAGVAAVRGLKVL